MRLLLSLALFSLAASVSAQTADLSARIDAIAHAALTDGPVAGLSIAVIQEDEVVHAEGYGWADIENQIPATAETVYVIASVTKLLTGAGVMTLVDEGRLSLDDELATLLPTFPNPEQGRRITLRHLLTHTSGLPDLLDAALSRWEERGEPLTPDFALDVLDGRSLDFEPGTNWSYTNTGAYLAGLIIERTTGQPYGAYIRDALARPLGLHDTFLCDDDLLVDRRTVGYAPGDSELVRTQSYETAGQKTGFGAAGGFCSTALDLVRLPDALKDHEVLSEASLAMMLQPTTLADGSQVDYGLGVRSGLLDGHTVWGRTGGNRSTWATVAHYPEDAVTIAVLVNTDGISENAWVLEGRIAREVLGLGRPRVDERPIATEALRPYTGLYEDVRGNRRFQITADDGRLHLAVLESERPARPLVHLGDHTFGFPDIPTDRLVFQMQDGEAQGYSLYWDGLFSNYRQRVGP